MERPSILEKRANPAARALGAIGLGGAGAYGAHELGKHLDYNVPEKVLSILSGASVGGLAYAKMNPLLAKLLIPAIVAGEAAPAALRGIRAAVDNQRAQAAAAKSPAKYILPAAAAGVGLATVPALMNISRAADRVADGRAIRVSTSLRKRPNSVSDLKLVVMSPEEKDREIEKQELMKQEKEQRRGILGGIL
jgi:hypothetical protein